MKIGSSGTGPATLSLKNILVSFFSRLDDRMELVPGYGRKLGGFWVIPMTHEQMEFPWETWETFAKAVIRVQLPLMMPETCQKFNRPMPTQQSLFEELAYVEH